MSEQPSRIVDFPPCPFQSFLEHMNESGCPEWVWSFIEMCSRFGVCYSSPDNTLLARPVNSAVSEADLAAFNDLDPNYASKYSGLTEKPDTWHILYGSGDPSFFFDLCPYELPKLSWHRNKGTDRLKTYDFQRIKARFHGKQT